MRIKPFIIGRGNAGLAIAKSIAIVKAIDFELASILSDPTFLSRTDKPEALAQEKDIPILFIANPHALHTDWITRADSAGIKYIVAEKPAAVSLDQLERLKKVNASVSICHVYRQTWGPQTLREMIQSGELGDLIAIEGRYWQSSAARRAVGDFIERGGWKGDVALSGPYDVLIDVAPHWVDLVFFLAGAHALKSQGWLSYANSGASHRDTHLQLVFEFPWHLRSIGSVSKAMHGATNDLEINVLGSKQSATWCFEKPDQLIIGAGGKRLIKYRETQELGTRQPAFHGAGWLEGYVDIVRRVFLSAISGSDVQGAPTLKEHIDVLETLMMRTSFNNT